MRDYKIELPIDHKIPDILNALSEHQNLVLTAAPGAGKTTRLPPALIHHTKKKIIVLEPRRVAAVAAASRIAEEQNWKLGQEIGYQVRFDSCIQPHTKITFITEALLARKLLTDPELSEYDCVILDEFHERSIHTDLAIGLLKELQALSRPDLKIIVMSATMDANKVAGFLDDCPIIDVDGRVFEMELTYSKSGQSLNLFGAAGLQFIDKVCEQIKFAMGKSANKSLNDILVFLPGVGEIRRVHDQIQNWASLNQISIFDLHGSLSLQEQKAVLSPLDIKLGQRKLILATNIAESALTVDGVSVVIDSGLARVMHFNSDTGIQSLNVQRISKASATQRAGRAARQTEGQVYRMWSTMDEISMPDFEVPEISRTDLAEVVLFLANQGITDFQKFSWFENPDSIRLKIAIEQLKLWQALDPSNRITAIGKKMSALPLHPRLSRLLLEGEKLGQIKFAADICAILSEMRGNDSKNSQNTDLFSNWEFFNRNRNQQRNVAKLSDQLCEQLNARNKKEKDPSEQVLERLLVAAYPDRICRKRKSGEKNEPNTQGRRAIMTTGFGVELTENSAASQQEFFIALQLVKLSSSQDMKVSLTSSIAKSLITEYFKEQIKEESRLEFNEETHKFQKTIQKKLLKMPIEEPRMTNATAEEVETLLPNLAMEKWDLLKSKNENLAQWLIRLEWYETKTHCKILNENEIQAALASACYGEKSLASLFEKDLVYFFENELPRETIKNLHDSCPKLLTLPSTKTVKIQYFSDKNPAVEARLQEFFGWKVNPVISHSSIPDSINKPIPLTLILLGPNYRPVQITQDLGQFWKTSYLEIRKELRGRYPKHKWPEDPVNFHFETSNK